MTHFSPVASKSIILVGRSLKLFVSLKVVAQFEDSRKILFCSGAAARGQLMQISCDTKGIAPVLLCSNQDFAIFS